MIVCIDCQVFVAWCCYIDSRRCKAARYSLALDVYRRRLLVEGATKWLSVSSDLAQLRMKFATQKGVEVSAAVFSHSFVFKQFKSYYCSKFTDVVNIAWLMGTIVP